MAKPLNHIYRASKAWPILISVAKRSRTITYGELSSHLKIHVRAISYVLGVIQSYCLDNRLPPLTVNVVNKKGIIGAGFVGCKEHEIDVCRKRAEKYEWGKFKNPFSKYRSISSDRKISSALTEFSGSMKDLWKLSKVRGSYQTHFRNALLKVYGNSCAISGSNIVQALDAAHIVSVKQCRGVEKIDIRNGVLLSKYYHTLFDSGIITLTNKNVFILAKTFRTNELSSYDKYALKIFPKKIKNVQDIYLPADTYIEKRNRKIKNAA